MTSRMGTSVKDEMIGIVQLGELIDRVPATIRHWEREGILPKSLMPKRDARGWRWWTPSQAQRIKEWMVRNDMRPGKSLPQYHPTAAEQSEVLRKMRRRNGSQA